jgi:hypothetical protein
MKAIGKVWRTLLPAILALLATSCATTSGQPQVDPTIEARRDALLELRDQTITDLVASRPGINQEIASAVGYGVFTSTQYNIVLLVMGDGAGVLTDNQTGKARYMKMARVGGGPSFADQPFRQLIIFRNRDLFDTFSAVGADVSASTNGYLKAGTGKGLVLDGSISFNPMLSSYQLTDKGLVSQANWGGVGYLPDEALNR